VTVLSTAVSWLALIALIFVARNWFRERKNRTAAHAIANGSEWPNGVSAAPNRRKSVVRKWAVLGCVSIPRFAVIWTLLSVLATFLIYALLYPQHGDFAGIAAHPATAQGVVSYSDPGDHESFGYRYRVGTTAYSGSSYGSAMYQPEASSLHAGQAIRVVYDTTDPSLSCACDAHASADQFNFWQDLIAVCSGTFIIAVLLTIRLTRRRTARRVLRGLSL
jgi:hypothetical protein